MIPDVVVEWQPPVESVMPPDLAVAAVMGFGDGFVPEHVLEPLHEMMEECLRMAVPVAGYRIVGSDRCRFEQETIHIDETELHTSPIIASRLHGCETIAVFVASCGEPLDRRIRSLNETGDILHGFMLDAIASEMTERIGDAVERRLQEEMAVSARKLTNRMSPGYCFWEVSRQRTLFSLVPRGFCGVSLTPGAFMTPVKSISGIIGIGPRAVRDDEPCLVCDHEECLRRGRPSHDLQ